MNARTWANRLIESIRVDVRQELATDPIQAMAKHFQITVRATHSAPSRRGYGGQCDGLSIFERDLVLYVPTESRRQNFTLLHELGHFLARDPEVLEWAADLENPSRAIEEVCDYVAAGLLLPSDVIDRAMGGQKPTGASAIALYNASIASREACLIALAERLGCEGFVLLVGPDREIVGFASRVADTRPYPWRGDRLPKAHRLRTLASNRQFRGESWWPFSDGEQRAYYLDAASDDSYVYAVFAAADLWNISPLHLSQPSPSRIPTVSRPVLCANCGYQGATYQFPCSDCHQPYCPRCGKCACDRRAWESGQCRICFCSVPRRRLRDGVCNDCQSSGRARS